MYKRIIILVMDSVGIGHAPDAAKFNDEGSNTLGHIEATAGLIHCPTLRSLGLANIADIKTDETPVMGAYGKMEEVSTGKDTTSGHWEMMGHPVTVPFPTFYDGFPKELMDTFTKETGYGYLGNEVASGTEIIERLGVEHMKTGKPIVYTSADSVFQIAAHEDVIPLEDLYRMCEITRNKVCVGDYYVGRIIARPYVGEPGNFTRTANRRDLAVSPFAPTVLDKLNEAGIDTYAVGKINDIFNGAGINHDMGHNKSNSHGIDTLIKTMGLPEFEKGFSFTNLVDFDALYGHRRNAHGYRDCLHEFDERLPEIMAAMREDDLLLITADHGNDPTYAGTDHTREYIPLLAYSPAFKGNGLLPVGHFADISATIADNFGVETAMIGESFLDKLV